jgi:hypothetical protein
MVAEALKQSNEMHQLAITHAESTAVSSIVFVQATAGM